jgi:pimeloyl-ACP methyl ester carboxylesterase
MNPKSNFFSSLHPDGFHKIHYLEWGNSRNPKVIICVHGLSRNARDFDFLAQELAKDYRVISVDMPGRGLSDHFASSEFYNFSQYVTDLVTLIARMDVSSLDWIGTSMGGLLGMIIASKPNNPIKRLVLNDIGPFVSSESMIKIRNYIGITPNLQNFEKATKYISQILRPFGDLSSEQWQHLALHSTKQLEDGSYILSYDPKIATAFSENPQDIDLWNFWNEVSCPTLLLRGEKSEILTQEIAKKMQDEKGQITFAEFKNIGHAPSLMEEEQIEVIRNWLS